MSLVEIASTYLLRLNNGVNEVISLTLTICEDEYWPEYSLLCYEDDCFDLQCSSFHLGFNLLLMVVLLAN